MSRRRSENTLIGMRLQLLASQQQFESKSFSPMLNDLREDNTSRVKKFLELFEMKPWRQKVGVNWWLDGMTPLVLQSKAPTVFKFPRTAPEINDAMFLKELLKMEETHIRTISTYTRNVKEVVKELSGYIAMKLRENEFCLYGDLKTIYGLHKIVIRPFIAREEFNRKCIEFVKFVAKLIDEGHLNCYVSHKMLEKSMDKLHREYIFLMQQKAVTSGVFKILESYNDWIVNVCNEFMKHPTENADNIALCLDAERKLMNLIETISEAESISHISQVYDVPLEVHFKVFEIVKKREEIQKPMLLLVPKKNKSFSYRYPINILQLGNFIRTFEFQMTSKEHGYKNESRFFVFECCVIYTTVVRKDLFSYENHFWIKDVAFHYEYAQLVNCDHTIQIDNAEMIKILKEQKKKHGDDEITAEINMTEYELIRIVESVGDVKKWRRHSIIPIS